MTTKFLARFALVLVLVLASASGVRAYEEKSVDAAQGGWVEGVVKIDRDVPPMDVEVTHHHEGCAPLVKHRGILATDKLLKDVAVWIEKIDAGKPLPTEPVILDQVACEFVPHVFAINPKQSLTIRTSDSVLHNVSASLGEEKLFDLAMPIKGMELWKRPIEKDGAPLENGNVRFSCRAGHSWMESWAVVKDHPYVAVSADDGSWRIDAVPPGTYTLKFWHPILGEYTESFTVEAGAGVRLDLTLPVPDELLSGN